MAVDETGVDKTGTYRHDTHILHAQGMIEFTYTNHVDKVCALLQCRF